MRSRICAGRHGVKSLAAAAVSVLLLAGCAAGPVEGGGADTHGPSSASAVSTSAAADGPPSAASTMVCGDETRANIVRIMALPDSPRTTDSWADRLYTCTYALPAGSLVLSVKETADPAAARAHFDGLQQETVSARPIEGMANLGLPAFETPDGSVAFVKDSFVLTVDATALPAALGPHSVSRNAFVYEVATAVLACWSE